MRALILAGGEGMRLWPLSKKRFPKQFLNFGSGVSLLQQTVLRFNAAHFISQVIVATNELYHSLVLEQLEKIKINCPVLIEPARKNTAPAIGLAMKTLQEKYHVKKTEKILVIPSDHLIEPEVIFLNVLAQLDPKDKMVTFGIRPLKVETGYGYIEIGKSFDSLCFQVKRFIEKPAKKLAKQYVNCPQFFWNLGIFLFTVETFWKQLKLYSLPMYNLFQSSLTEVIRNFDQMPNKSIDYTLMEKSKEILVCPLAVSWSDVGSWDSVYEVMEKDADRNVKIGQVLTMNTRNSLIIGSKKVVSTIGLDDLLIIETEEAVLICKKGESQKVKKIIRELNKTSL